ncbi:MAG TPA: tRNA 2-thiouridine(34) synthase MnmA, partial [Caldithrix sp.]|nr:tRNA 2-thiouridine(34) synthase MnmA [Caldithrix sp.]
MATLHSIDSDQVRIVFDEPQKAITPGQSAVFYDGDKVLGGGIIDSYKK